MVRSGWSGLGERLKDHSLAAMDLRDLVPEEHGARYPEWLERVERQARTDRYWIGETEIVVFPWCEPDHNFWNPVTEESEWGWRLVPPEHCLKRGGLLPSGRDPSSDPGPWFR